ncbi:MAG: S41 family peptidase, partial [Chlamydiae bacterium]|nr:S41 family peptidase [Chlamydiota bacterium]
MTLKIGFVYDPNYKIWFEGGGMTFRYFSILFLFLASLLCARPPELTPHDAKTKIQEILNAHISRQNLNEELIKRAFSNYLDELDPIKTYFTQGEIDKWANPSAEILQDIVKQVQDGNFTAFAQCLDQFLLSLPRREAFEQAACSAPPIKGVKSSEFINLPWASSEEELKERILRIKSLQIETAEALAVEERDQMLRRLEKRRLCREEGFQGKNNTEKQQIVLSYALKAISSALDSQTAYFTPSEAKQFMMQVQQKLYGIGAQLRDDLNGLTVTRLLEGGPAIRSNNLKVGDKIISVNKEPIVGMDIKDAVDLIKGRQGTPVTLTILRANDSPSKEHRLDIEIIRDEVVLKETRLDHSIHPVGDGCIGVFHLFSFYKDTKTSSSSDLYKAIYDIKKTQNLKGVILDLRGNLGGVLQQAVAVAGLFISKGIVASVKDNTGKIEHLRNLGDKLVWDGPLLILVNRLSASASEIVAQTLQEYGRALVVGDETTFGKGTFQTFTLEAAHYGKVNPKGEYKVTRGRYYTVSGKSPQLVGVQSDIVIPGILSNMDIGEKFSKFPLGTDQIEPGFHDDLSDISPLLRTQIKRLYKSSHQDKIDLYRSYLTQLRHNSK